MSEPLSPARFAGKIEWEGGLYDAVAGYGLSEKDLDRDANSELWELVQKYAAKCRELEPLEQRILGILDSYDDEDEE